MNKSQSEQQSTDLVVGKYINHSQLNTWQGCKRRWKYRYIDNLKGVEQHQEAMDIGTKLHADVATLLQGLPVMRGVSTSAIQCHDLITAQLPGYELICEQTIRYEWDEHNTIIGTPDVLGIMDDELIIVDIKSTRNMDPGNWWRKLTLDRQMVLYAAIAGAKHPHAHVFSIAYAVVDVTPEDEPKINKDGMVSVAQQTCSADAYRAALASQPKPATEKQLEYLTKLEQRDPVAWYQRSLSPNEMTSAKVDALLILAEIKDTLNTGAYVRSRGSCSFVRCPYEDTCVGDPS